MAIVQISRITQRKGLQIDLPQLAGAEFGWSIDERRLFIGNGTLEEGAPVIGNTEILTEFSDILGFLTTYTYKGLAGGYQVQTTESGTPISLSLQTWMDQWASVKDFGAVGDGITDDTAAINWALKQLYCVDPGYPAVRRALFFPAGVYKVSNSIVIPPYATLYGEGAQASIIQMQAGDDSALTEYVARTGDSLQQTGADIGTNGATTPQYVTITNMAFQTLDNDTLGIFFFEDTINSSVNNCSFIGPYNTTFITDTVSGDPTAYPLAGVVIESTNGEATNITLDRCVYSGCTYGMYNATSAVNTINVTGSSFNTLYTGLLLDNSSTVGFKVLHNIFDIIYDAGINSQSSFFASANNSFFDVANGFDGAGNPINNVILINGVSTSYGDMFERDDTDAVVYARINLNGTTSIATTNGQKLQMGTYTRDSGFSATLINATGSATTIFSTTNKAFTINYTIKRATDSLIRTGVISATNYNPTGTLTWSDDYNENSDTGFVISLSNSSGTTNIQYQDTLNTGHNGTFYYSINYLD